MIDFEINFGVNIVEIVTKGLYPNALDTFREYIQNSCDAIDNARQTTDKAEQKILKDDEGTIEIKIDKNARRITIKDDGTGIPVLDFKSTLTNIGYSDKTLETDRGFRGIGRLCGLAYCRELRFISTAKGEGIQSTVIFNAEKLREISRGEKKYTVKEALDEIVSSETAVADSDEHFFRVELIDIVDTNDELLDVAKVRDYLSFVAPVTYSSQLYYQTEIYKHAAALNFTITEYKILVNGEQVVKNYKTTVKTFRGGDEIFGVDFRDFKNDNGKLIAWSWIGLSTFKGVLNEAHDTPDYKMRGIRLRAGNIQIGDAEVFKNLFSEQRGTKYFIGEVHIVDTNLIPNARRDNLEKNSAYEVLEDALKKYFEELSEIYRTASGIRSEHKKINAPADAEQDFQRGHSTCKNRAELDAELVKLNKTAESAKKKILDMREGAEKTRESALSRVVLRMTETSQIVTPPPQIIFCRRLMKQNLFRPFIGAKI